MLFRSACRSVGWRGLRIRVARSGLDLRYRSGFFASQPPPTELAARDEMQLAMASPLLLTAIPMRLQWGQVSAGMKQGKRLLPFAILLPSDSLYVDAGKRSMSLEVKYRITNEVGAVVDGSQETVLGKISILDEFRLAPMRFESQIIAPPGKYNVKVLVRDNLTGKMGSVTGTTVVP